MEYNKNPLTPHLQIYKWQISSLLSITHRITGVINAIAISTICIWFLFMINFEKILFENFLDSFLVKKNTLISYKNAYLNYSKSLERQKIIVKKENNIRRRLVNSFTNERNICDV